MRDILTIIACIVIVLLMLLLGVPYLVNWSEHRTAVEARLSQALGTPVEISGAIDIKILPTPTLSIERFAAGADTIRLSAEAAHFELSLMPLLRGEYQILEADIQAPRLSTLIDSTGAITLPAMPAGKGGRVQIDKLVVRNGAIVLNDPTRQRSTEISALSFDGNADSLFGPVKGQGRFKRDGQLVGYRFSTGAADADRLRVKLVLDLQGDISRADLDGALVAKLTEGRRRIGFEGTGNFSGRFATGDAAGLPWRVTATGNADMQSLHASNVEVRLGDEEISLTAAGEAEAQLGDAGAAHIDLTSRQIDLDRFQSKFDLMALLRAANGTEALPGFPLSLDWHTDTITLGGDTASEAFVGLQLGAARPLTLSANAALPARSRFSIAGTLERGAAAGFKGKLEFISRDPERFAGWIAPTLPDMAENLRTLPFKNIEIAGQAGISAAGFFVRDLDAKLDRSAFAGTLSYTRALGAERARLFADLTSPALDLEKLPNLSDAAKGVGGMDVSAALDAKAVKVGGFAASAIDAGRIRAKFIRDGEETRLERLSISDLGGANIEASGRWREGTAKVDAKLDAAQLGDLTTLTARLLPGRAASLLQSRAAALSPAHLTIKGESDPGRPGLFDLAVMTIDGRLGATRGTMRLAQAADDPEVSEATVLLDAPEAAALARQIGLTVLPLRGLGKGRVAGTARGRLGAPWTGRLEATFAGTTMNLDGILGLDGMLAGDPDRPAFSGNVKVASGDAVPLLQLLAMSLPDISARLPIDFGGRLDWTPISWRLDRLAGSVNGGAISGRLSRPTNATTIQGALTADRLPIQTIAQTILGPEQPTKVGAVWSDATFGKPLADPPQINLDLRAARLDVSDNLAGRDASLHLSLAPGALGIDRLSMRLAGGRVDGSVTLRREEDNVAFSGRLAFDNVAIDRPAFGTALTGSLEFASSGKSEAAIAGGLAGAGEIGLSNVRLNGLDPLALPRVLALSDEEKIDVDAKAVDIALARELDRAPFKANSEAYYDAALAGGVLKLSPRSTYSTGPMRTSLQTMFDTRSFGLNVQADITLAAIPRDWLGPAPQISLTLAGLLTHPTRRIESGSFLAGLTARVVQREADRIASLEFDIKERAFFNRRLKWDRARQEERDRAAADQARAEQERIEQERRAEHERREQERRAAAEAEAAQLRAAAEAEAAQRRAAAEAEAARRRAESTPTGPTGTTNPFLRPQPLPAPGTIAPNFRAPAANQDPSAAGRY